MFSTGRIAEVAGAEVSAGTICRCTSDHRPELAERSVTTTLDEFRYWDHLVFSNSYIGP